MKKFFCFIYLACLVLPLAAQDVLSLDSCRTLAIANNKELLIGRTKIEAAHYQRKAAFTTICPAFPPPADTCATRKSSPC